MLEKRAQVKLMRMYELEQADNAYANGVINFADIDLYKSYVLDHKEREYDVVMLMNLNEEEMNKRCPQCKEAEERFLNLASSWQNARGKPSEIGSRKVFFGIYTLDASKPANKDVFIKFHHFDTVPWLAVSPERNGKVIPGEAFFNPHHQLLIRPKEVPSAEKMNEILNKILNTDVQYRLTME